MQRQELLKLGYSGSGIDVIPNLFDEGKLRRWDREIGRAHV